MISKCFALLLSVSFILVTCSESLFAQRFPPPPPGGKSMIERFDENGDGKVSKDEFKGPEDHFIHLDKNEDGYIDESEEPGQPPPPPRNKRGPADGK